MRAANLTRADCSRDNMQRVILIGAKLIDASFVGADLRSANLKSAEFTAWPHVFMGADLRGADMSQTNLEGAKIRPNQLKQPRSLKGSTRGDDIFFYKIPVNEILHNQFQPPRSGRNLFKEYGWVRSKSYFPRKLMYLHPRGEI